MLSTHVLLTEEEFVTFFEDHVKQPCLLMIVIRRCGTGSAPMVAIPLRRRRPHRMRQRAAFIITLSKQYRFATEEEFAPS